MRPKTKAGVAIDTMSPGAIEVKKAAAIAFATIAGQIRDTHAMDVDGGALVVDGYFEGWMTAWEDLKFAECVDSRVAVFLAYLALVHLVLFFLLAKWACRKIFRTLAPPYPEA